MSDVRDLRRRIPPLVVDAAVALGIVAAQLAAGLTEGAPAAHHPVGLAALVLGGLVLLARRRSPVVVLAATGLLALAHLAAGYEVLAMAFLVAVYTAFRAGRRAPAVVAAGVLIVALPLVALPRAGSLGPALLLGRHTLELAWLVAAAAAGEAVRLADRRAEEAERGREETARRRADDERLRIARELHDSLMHQISIVTVQSDVAVRTARRRGDEVPESLLAVQAAARDASRELRATLGALRSDATTPPPGLADVPALVDRARGLSVEATLTTTGEPREVPDAVGRTAYRVVQEALTNVARHAGTGAARVVVAHEPDALIVRIDDDGGAAPVPPGDGTGLVGMRERVQALGGRLDAGPRPGGGFRVHARLPVEGP